MARKGTKKDAPPEAERGEPAGGAGGAELLDRELSWLDFNARVLALAEDPSVPLLERLKFLAIFSANLDEFFMVRVAGLAGRAAAGLGAVATGGLEPEEQLKAIRARVLELVADQTAIFAALPPALAEAGIRLGGPDGIEPAHRKELGRRFEEQLFPVLTPLAVDPGHPFPYISNLSLNLRSHTAVVWLSPCSRNASSRCSRRSPSTLRIRSLTSPTSRSTSRSWCAIPRSAKTASPA